MNKTIVQTAHLPTLRLTQAAHRHLSSLIEKKRQQMPKLFLRVFAAQGCAGIQYGFSFVEQKKENDTQMLSLDASNDQSIDLPLLTDSDSGALIDGAVLDFVEEPDMGSRFVVNNPNDFGGGCSSCASDCGV
jgi:iron-sulfur cluster assembly accessory protein